MGLLENFNPLWKRRRLDPTSNAYPKGIHKGDLGGLSAVETDLIAANVKLGKQIFGINGTMVSWVYDLKAEQGLPPTLVTPIPSIAAPAVVADASGGAFTSTPTLTVPEPTIAVAVPVPTSNAVGGAVQNDEGTGETDETAAANNATANDMHIFPAVSAVNDSYRIGYVNLWDYLCLNIGTAGVGTYTIGVQYSKGGGNWGTLTTLGNEVANMTATGRKWVWWNRPGDWAIDTFGGIGNLYWIQFILTVRTSMTVNPLGTQAWAGVLT